MKKKVMAVALAAATVVSMVGATGVSAATEVAKNTGVETRNKVDNLQKIDKDVFS